MKHRAYLMMAIPVLASACGPADDVDVLPLPSLEESSLESRAGVPEISGTWSFAGWELAEGDSAALEGDLPGFGALVLETQKRDSLAGRYAVQAGSAPLYGEVRRDSVVALVSVLGPGDLRYLTGRVAADTVWIELTSLVEAGSWPRAARAAFVRGQVAEPFVRLRGAVPPPVARVDTTPAIPAPPAAGQPGAPAVTAPPAAAPSPMPTPTPRPQPSAPAPTPQPQPQPQPRDPTPPEVDDAPPVPQPQPEPEPAPQPEPEEPPIPLLGEPAPGF